MSLFKHFNMSELFKITQFKQKQALSFTYEIKNTVEKAELMFHK